MAARVDVRLSDFADVSDTLRLIDVGRVVRLVRGRDMVDWAQPQVDTMIKYGSRMFNRQISVNPTSI